MADTSVEFTCCECGRHIVQVVGPKPEFLLCAVCMFVPGWMAVPHLRWIYDPLGRLPPEKPE